MKSAFLTSVSYFYINLKRYRFCLDPRNPGKYRALNFFKVRRYRSALLAIKAFHVIIALNFTGQLLT